MPWLIANGIALALYAAATALHLRRGLRGPEDAAHARFFAGVGVAMHISALVGEAATALFADAQAMLKKLAETAALCRAAGGSQASITMAPRW